MGAVFPEIFIIFSNFPVPAGMSLTASDLEAYIDVGATGSSLFWSRPTSAAPNKTMDPRVSPCGTLLFSLLFLMFTGCVLNANMQEHHLILWC